MLGFISYLREDMFGFQSLKCLHIELHVVKHTFNPYTLEEGAVKSLSLRVVWSTEQVSGQSGLQRETLSQKTGRKMHIDNEISWLCKIQSKAKCISVSCIHYNI